MLSIEWLSSRDDESPVEITVYPGSLTRGALILAKAFFRRIRERHPEAIGCRIVGGEGEELGRWFPEDDPEDEEQISN